jgi:hypothetical protein
MEAAWWKLRSLDASPDARDHVAAKRVSDRRSMGTPDGIRTRDLHLERVVS